MGWSKPGTEVTVEFAGQKKQAKAGADGKWLLKLDALAASAEPRDMTIAEKNGASRTLKDILVGEVWMASCQSNAALVVADQGANFGSEMSALTNSFISDFGGKAQFYYTMPSKELAPKITTPSGIQGEHQAIEIKDWKAPDCYQGLIGKVAE